MLLCHEQASEVAALLQWLGAELPQLPDAERIEAIRLAPLLFCLLDICLPHSQSVS